MIKRLPLPNRQLSCQSHKSNQRLIASLPLSLFHSFASSFSFTISLLSPSPSSIFAIKWRAMMHCVFNCMYCSPVPRRLFFPLRYQQGALLIRDIEPYNNDISHMAATGLVLCMTWLELASVIRLVSFFQAQLVQFVLVHFFQK